MLDPRPTPPYYLLAVGSDPAQKEAPMTNSNPDIVTRLMLATEAAEMAAEAYYNGTGSDARRQGLKAERDEIAAELRALLAAAKN